MRAVCLIVLVVLTLQVASLSIFKKSTIVDCCKILNKQLKSENIKSYNRTDDNFCRKKAFFVECKDGKRICVDATSPKIISAIKKFDAKNKGIRSNNMAAMSPTP
ncbi:C-C motif chemokine 2-like [Hyla sarda]|uniref:C-C motif chemokine 2-like n=1 Tax=Hyla sarda TaxID=327740 RepID=UPI0024C338B7|nr:C-C motif chemokine 2-like [Hyla sarda]